MSTRSGEQAPEFRLTISPACGTTVVAAHGELDIASAEEFAATLREHLARGPVVLDLGDLSFMDSSGVRVLDAVLRDAASEGWTFGVRRQMQEGVRQVLEMTGMMPLLPLYPG